MVNGSKKHGYAELQRNFHSETQMMKFLNKIVVRNPEK